MKTTIACVLSSLTLVLAACGGSTSRDVTAGRDVDPEAAEVASADDAFADVAGVPSEALPSDLPDGDGADGGCSADCPAGFCDEELRACLWCSDDVACPFTDWWCKAGTCVATACVPGRTTCDGVAALRTCGADGETWTTSACDAGAACRDGGCEPVICAPADRTCEDQKVAVCDDTGTFWTQTHCPLGQGCFGDDCVPYRQNVLLVFDTSSSMSSVLDMDAIPCLCAGGCPAEPFPACEQLDCPRSKLGLSKLVFTQLFQSEQGKTVSLGMIHFPLRIVAPPTLQCTNPFGLGIGWYGQGASDDDLMTGDDGDHAPGDDSYFEERLYEILAVPFPSAYEEDPLAAAGRWVNGAEAVGASTAPCGDDADCPGGFCGLDGGLAVCFFHTDPELRAVGNTPLGRTLFYAGEYYRKFIVVQGKPCQASDDCGNVNYVCKGGACTDPYRKCRANKIVILTDGVEFPATTATSFFNPAVQAKRLRHGLGCQTSADCNDPAFCAGDLCGGFAYPYRTGGGGPLTAIEGQGHERLFDRAGDPIVVATSVIDLSAEGEAAHQNKQIADNGGGVYFQANTGDPSGILAQIFTIFDVKENLGCVPE